MKANREQSRRRGFTLMELMVAMTITTVMVAVLVNITNTAVDTWSRGRYELRAARQAKAMIDVLANDFESLVIRSGGTDEWMSLVSNLPTGAPSGGGTNAVDMVFFTAATDRYDGQIGRSADKGGDISCVGYRLLWKDPLEAVGGGQPMGTYVLNRHLVNPDETFNNLLGQAVNGVKLEDLFMSSYGSELEMQRNFVCENIFQFTIVLHIELQVPDPNDPNKTVIQNRVISLMDSGAGTDVKREFRIRGNGVVTDPLDAALQNGRVTAVELALTVMTDSGITTLRNEAQPTDPQDYAKWLAKNSFHYSKLVQLPRL